jgi:ribosomal protein S12 methylthiotransferase accessory factor
MVNRLVDAGFNRVIVIRHTPPEDPIQVVRVLVPGLEGYPFAYAKVGKRGVRFAQSKEIA